MDANVLLFILQMSARGCKANSCIHVAYPIAVYPQPKCTYTSIRRPAEIMNWPVYTVYMDPHRLGKVTKCMSRRRAATGSMKLHFCTFVHVSVLSFPAVGFTVKIFSVRGSWITEWCFSGCWTMMLPPNLKAAVLLQIARTPLKMISWNILVESGWRLSWVSSPLLYIWV